jgi:hypothetical protein
MMGILLICLVKVNLMYEEVEISNLDGTMASLSLRLFRKVCMNQNPCSLVDIRGRRKVERQNVRKMMSLS